MRGGELSWHGGVERKGDDDYVKACTRLLVEGTAPVGRPRKTWAQDYKRFSSMSRCSTHNLCSEMT